MNKLGYLILWCTLVNGRFERFHQQLGQWPLHDPAPDLDYNPLNRNFEAFINKTLEDFQTPGLAVAVVHGNRTWSAGYGYADLDSGHLVTPHTLFQGGSTTKSFIAALVSKLVYAGNGSEFGNIEWNTRLSDLIRDDFVLQDEYATQHLTLADALSHRTGMPRHDLSWINGDPGLKDIVRSLRYLPLHNELRTTYEYCNLMFSTVAHTLEVVTGQKTGELLRQWIWDPIGMNETVYSMKDAFALARKKDNDVTVAAGYYYDEIKESQVKVPWPSIVPANGAGGVVTNVLDYAKWVRQFLTNADGVQRVLPSEAIEQITYPRVPIQSDGPPWTGGSFYGYGIRRGVYRGYNLVGHNGADSGYMARIQWIPELNWGFVILHNSFRMTYEPVGWRLIDDFLEVPDEERFDAVQAVNDLKQSFYDKLKNARARLFPGSPKHPSIQPSAPLKKYAGLYHHPAYHNFTLSIDSKQDVYPNNDNDDIAKLYVSPSAVSYDNISGILEHVNGEFWLARMQFGAPSWLGNQAAKVQFDVRPDGEVSRMGFQAEDALDDLAWFDKLT